MGHISDKDESQMEELLSNGDVTVTISASEKNNRMMKEKRRNEKEDYRLYKKGI